jgi:hypothetical protein
VRLTRIESVDLSLFEFDYDLTFVVFFLSPEGKVYARYGGRDSEGPDNRQSLPGLRYTMQSVLQMHGNKRKIFAPRSQAAPRTIQDVTGVRRSNHCLHCHQVREILTADLQKKGKWRRDMYWRYPLPENLGFELEVDRGNRIAAVKAPSPASVAGLKTLDIVERLNGVPIHSFGDAQYALDIAPKTGAIEVVWRRGDKILKDKLALPEDWRRTDMSWRTSLRYLIPTVRLWGIDLTPEEKKALELPANRLAFRTKTVSAQAQSAGIRAGDVILGIDDKPFEMNRERFITYLQSRYLIGDPVKVNVLRDGKRLSLPMTIIR